MGTAIAASTAAMLRRGDMRSRKVPATPRRPSARVPQAPRRPRRGATPYGAVYPKETDESCMYGRVRQTPARRRRANRAQPAAANRRLGASAAAAASEATDPFDRTRSSPFPLPPSSRAVERGAEFTVRPSGSERLRETPRAASASMTVQEMLVFATRNENE